MRSAALALVASFLALGTTTVLEGVEPVYFRHDGGVAKSHVPLPENFDQDARLLWRTELPPGNSTPCVMENSIFVTTYDQSAKHELATVALDCDSGAARWKQVVPVERVELFHPVGSPASSSPASDGERVYSFFGSYGLLCYTMDGEPLWSKRLGPFQDEFGASSSPVLADGKIFLNEDHDVNSFLMAIDASSGETVWDVAREGFVRSYSTPIVVNGDEGKQVVVAGALQLTGYDMASGERLWWVNGLSRIVDSSPTQAGGKIYMATWSPGGDEGERISMESFPEAITKYDANKDVKISKDELPAGEVQARFFRMDLNQDQSLDAEEWITYSRVFERAQNVAMAVRPEGRGDLTETAVQWTFRRGLPTVPSAVIYDGMMYMVKDGGIITNLDANSGELLKQGRAAGTGNFYASLVAGDGKVYLCSEAGVVNVLRSGREWEILSRRDFGERIMATPVLDNGRVYLRTDAALYCFEKKS